MAAQSRFGQHVLLWLLLPVVLVVAVPAIPDPGFARIAPEEIAGNTRLLGAQANNAAMLRARALFERVAVRSGLLAWSFATFAPVSSGRVRIAPGRRAATAYLRRVWWTVYKGCYRFEIATSWLMATGLVVAAALLDGTVRRRIKSFEFGYFNPVAFHLSAHGLVGLFGLLFALPFVPFGIQQWAWPLLIAGLAFGAWKAAESYQAGA